MIAWDKHNKHYWFCEARLPSGSLCRATKFNMKTEKEAKESFARHMSRVHNAN